MAITIDYSDPSEYVINVPKADMLLVSSSPTEIRQLDINDFRLTLNDLMDDADGMWAVTNHFHTPPLTVAGVTLSRVVEILDPYVILFEDLQYNVNIVGGNSNISDKVIKNQVGVNTANSAGLQDLFSLQAGSFVGGVVSLKAGSGFSGTLYPVGTRAFPVDNVSDAKAISEERGLNIINVIGDFTFGSGVDASERDIYGDSTHRSSLVFLPGSITTDVEFFNCSLTGTFDISGGAHNCHIETVIDNSIGSTEIDLFSCQLNDSLTLSPLAAGQLNFINCYSGVAGTLTPTVDLNGTNTDIAVRNYSGGLRITNLTNIANNVASLDFNSGQLIIDSSCTAGSITVRGMCKVTDNSTGTIVDTSQVVAPSTITDAVWDELASDHEDAGTMGRKLKQLIAKANAIIGLS